MRYIPHDPLDGILDWFRGSSQTTTQTKLDTVRTAKQQMAAMGLYRGEINDLADEAYFNAQIGLAAAAMAEMTAALVMTEGANAPSVREMQNVGSLLSKAAMSGSATEIAVAQSIVRAQRNRIPSVLPTTDTFLRFSAFSNGPRRGASGQATGITGEAAVLAQIQEKPATPQGNAVLLLLGGALVSYTIYKVFG